MTDEHEMYATRLDPRRDAVHEIMAAVVQHYDEDNPGQMFADIVMAMSILAHVWEAEISNVQPMFDAAAPNAKKAADGIEFEALH